MKTMFHAATVLLAYIVIVFICVIGYSFITVSTDSILAFQQITYKFVSGLLSFFSLFPAICITGVLIGFSWAFSLEKVGNLKRFSSFMIKNLKMSLIVSVICACFCFTVAELIIPSVQNSKEKIEQDYINYEEYIVLAVEYLEEENFPYAHFYLDSALSIYPVADEALQLMIELELKQAEKNAEIAREESLNLFKDGSSLTLLAKAQEAFDRGDYFNAHFHAMEVLYLCNEKDPNYLVAQQFASVAWNKLTETRAYKNPESEEFYARKKEGYKALMSGDAVKAYYIFAELYEASTIDPDVNIYMKEAREKLEEEFFFTDETTDIKDFEVSNNVYFSLQNSMGGYDLFYIKGITVIKNAGQLVQYLREFNRYRFSEEGELIESLYVPYAKLIAMPAASLSQEISRKYSDSTYVPYVLLESVDKLIEKLRIKPEYTNSNGDAVTGSNFLIFDMPYEDFNLVRQASSGADRMALYPLFRFGKNASKYGFSNEVYICNFAQRIYYPFLLVLVFIFVSLLGWNYRLLHGKLFEFKWIIAFPFFTAVAYYLLKLLLLLFDVVFFALYSLLGPVSIGIVFLCFVILLPIISLSLLSAHGE